MKLKRILTAGTLAGMTFLACPSVYAGLLVSSYNNNEILSYNQTTGAFEGVFASGGPLVNPNGLTFGPDGDLYAVDKVPTKSCVMTGRPAHFWAYSFLRSACPPVSYLAPTVISL